MTKSESSPDSELEKLRPTQKPRIMDLLRKAGIDVSDWGNYKRGPEYAASNPKYCYEWAFLEEGKVAVFNIWYDLILNEAGRIVAPQNLRRVMERFRSVSGKGSVVSRAQRMDEIAAQVASQRIPVRVVIGSRSIDELEEDESSYVGCRQLDDAFWHVTSYDVVTGDWVLERTSEGSTTLSIGRFREAFERINLSEGERALLTAIHASINHEANSREIARSLGYQGLAPVNRILGVIAKKILVELDLRTDSSDGSRAHHLLVLVDRIAREDTIVWRMKSEVARALELCGIADPLVDWAPASDEKPVGSGNSYLEGSRKLVSVNVYERSRKARSECIAAHGTKCTVCSFDFESAYGDIGKGYIHVHHLTPQSQLKCEYSINPVVDLRPVCPNCHAMLHSSVRTLSIEELSDLVRSRSSAP